MNVSTFAGILQFALLFRIGASHGPHGHPSIARSICAAAQESLPTFNKNSFLTEQCGNVIENKGPAWKTVG